MSRRLEVLSVAAVVAAASADSSIVALALPQLYGRFHTTVVGVSWVLTAYNAVVAVTAVALLAFRRLAPWATSLRDRGRRSSWWRRRPARCGRPDVPDRGAVRAGGGRRRSCSPARSVCCAARRARAAGDRDVWTLAAGVGVAAGPALGGVLTQVFDWRAIFSCRCPSLRSACSRGRCSFAGRGTNRTRDARGAILADLVDRVAVRRARRRAVPVRPVADPGLGLLADSRRGDRQRAAGGEPL